jgi:hypothetical protein
MPPYINRPYRDPNTKVRRHFSADAFLATIKLQQLRLTRIDTFDDQFEGSIPKQQEDDQLLTFSSHQTSMQMMDQVGHHFDMPSSVKDEDPWVRMTRRRRARQRAAHASCWTMGAESEPIWRLYCDDGRKCSRSVTCTLEKVPFGVGVAIETTISKLESSVVHHDLFVSPMNYRLYHEGPAFTAEADPFMNKRLGFEAENELRLLKFDEGHYLADFESKGTIPELASHIYLDWPVRDTIERIIVSPYADLAYEEHLKREIDAIEPKLLGCVELSVLHERRHRAIF